MGKDKDHKPIEHPIHEYHDTLKNIYLGDFMQSQEFQEWRRVSGKDTISFSKFVEGALKCRCIQQPSMRVCVDEVETGFAELVFMMKEIMRRSPTKRKDCCAFCRNEEARKADLGTGDFKMLMTSSIILCSLCLSFRLYSSFGERCLDAESPHV